MPRCYIRCRRARKYKERRTETWMPPDISYIYEEYVGDIQATNRRRHYATDRFARPRRRRPRRPATPFIRYRRADESQRQPTRRRASISPRRLPYLNMPPNIHDIIMHYAECRKDARASHMSWQERAAPPPATPPTERHLPVKYHRRQERRCPHERDADVKQRPPRLNTPASLRRTRHTYVFIITRHRRCLFSRPLRRRPLRRIAAPRMQKSAGTAFDAIMSPTS